MGGLSRKIIPIHSNETAGILTGTIVSVTGDDMCVQIQDDTFSAKKAFSCLIDPEPDDIVICSSQTNDRVYILGILERKGDSRANLSFPADACIEAKKGNLNIQTSNHLTLASDQLNCLSKNVIHKSQEAMISYEHLTASGEEVQAGFKTVRVVSNLINTMARQMINSFKGYIRKTEGSDIVKTGQMTRQIDGLYALDSKHTFMKSKKVTKIDGDKILMG